ncbi:DUF2561 family protein [Mycobacterium sp.]|uniref:DUF2561 family protein n=1 Tax=Mycobacterium sp. TaxID=1785 RepID=UPI003BAAA810
MVGRSSAYRRGPDTISADVVDRIMVGACAAVWLVLVGVSVAAAVALVDLGRGFHKMADSPHTTWVLYAVIVISALVIAVAIPVLLRTRRVAHAEPPPWSVRVRSASHPVAERSAARSLGQSKRAEPAEAVGGGAEWFGQAVDRIWLRGTLALAGAIGMALIAVATATYLMAVRHEGASWVSYGLAGAITAGMPVIEWLYVRQLRRVVAQL